MGKETPDKKEKAAMDEKTAGLAETISGLVVTATFWRVYGKQIVLAAESTLKSKHRLQFPFADSYLIVEKLWQSGEMEG